MNIPAFAAGIGIWSLLEYLSHRFLLHGPLLFRFHLSHHARPQDPGFDWKPSIIGGFLAGYVIYSYLHDLLHHGARLAALRASHDLHHRRPNCNFGVTTTLWDRVFRTFQQPVDGKMPPGPAAGA